MFQTILRNPPPVHEPDPEHDMTLIGPGLNDGELLPDDTPPIENDQPHGELADVSARPPRAGRR